MVLQVSSMVILKRVDIACCECQEKMSAKKIN